MKPNAKNNTKSAAASQKFRTKYKPNFVTRISLEPFRRLPRDSMVVVVLLFAMLGSYTLLQSRALNLDSSSPVTPTQLQAFTEANSLVLTWESGNDAAVTSYRVYRDGKQIGMASSNQNPANSASGLRYIDTTIIMGTTYTYRVQAVTADGKLSEQSEALTVFAGSPTNRTPVTLP